MNAKYNLLFLTIIPIYMVTICLDPSHSEVVGVSSLIILIFFLHKHNILKKLIKDPSLTVLLIFALYSTGINALGNGQPSHTGIIYGLSIPLLLGKAASLIREKKLYNDILLATGTFALFLLVAQILLLAEFGPDIAGIPLTELKLTFRNPTRTALFAGVAATISLTHLFVNHSQKYKTIMTLAAGSLLSAIVITGKRTTLAAVIVCTGTILAIQGRMRLIAILLSTSLCLIVVLGQTDRFNLNPAYIISSQGERMAVWYAASELFKKNPLTGTGFKTFKKAAVPYVQDFRDVHALPPTRFENLKDAHNLPLHLLSEGGIIGATIFFLIFVFPVRQCWRVRRTNPAAIPILTSLALILLVSQLHVMIFSLNVGGLTFFLTGLASGLNHEAS